MSPILAPILPLYPTLPIGLAFVVSGNVCFIFCSRRIKIASFIQLDLELSGRCVGVDWSWILTSKLLPTTYETLAVRSCRYLLSFELWIDEKLRARYVYVAQTISTHILYHHMSCRVFHRLIHKVAHTVSAHRPTYICPVEFSMGSCIKLRIPSLRTYQRIFCRVFHRLMRKVSILNASFRAWYSSCMLCENHLCAHTIVCRMSWQSCRVFHRLMPKVRS